MSLLSVRAPKKRQARLARAGLRRARAAASAEIIQASFVHLAEATLSSIVTTTDGMPSPSWRRCSRCSPSWASMRRCQPARQLALDWLAQPETGTGSNPISDFRASRGSCLPIPRRVTLYHSSKGCFGSGYWSFYGTRPGRGFVSFFFHQLGLRFHPVGASFHSFCLHP